MQRIVSLVLVLVPAARTLSAQAPPPPARPVSARPLPPVVVTATRDTISPLASPLPSAELGRVDLARDHGVSLSQTISGLPGVRSLSTGEQIGKPVIRGLTGSRVLVLDDGLRLEDYSWSDEDGPSVDARLAHRIEVIRGPASVLYGPDALAGVVNVIPAPLLDARGTPPIARTQLEVYGASNNGEAGGTVGVEGARGRLAARAVVVGRVGQNVRTPAGPIRNTGYLAGNGELALGVHHAGDAESALRFVHYGGEFQLLEIDAPPGGVPVEEGGPARVTLDDRLQLSHRRPVRGLDIELRGQLQRHALAERADDPAPAPGAPRETTVFDLVLNTATLDLAAHHGRPDGESTDRAPTVRGTFGVAALLQGNDSRGLIPLVPDATLASAGAFVFERVTVGRLSLLAGVRGDLRHLAARADPRLALPAQARSLGAVTGDLGLVYRLRTPLSVSLNVGRAWRAPTLFELYANGPRLGEGRYEYGRTSLGPETSLNVDAALRWQSPRLRAELSAFRTRVRDFIFIAPTGASQNNLRVYRYDQAAADLAGGEASLAADAATVLTVRGRVDGVRGTRRGTGDPLPLMPPRRAALGAELHSRDGSDARYLSADVEHVAAQSRLSRAEREAGSAPGRFPLTTGAHTLVALGAGTALSVRGRPSRLELRVRNLLNERYRDFLDRYKEFAYAPGTNVVLRLTTSF